MNIKVMTVNDAIDGLEILDGKYIFVSGLLSFEFEDHSVSHWPKSERRQSSVMSYYSGHSSLWIEIGSEAFAFNDKVLKRWSGKRVVIGGTLSKPVPGYGAGHMSGWTASILATQIELFKIWQRSH